MENVRSWAVLLQIRDGGNTQTVPIVCVGIPNMGGGIEAALRKAAEITEEIELIERRELVEEKLLLKQCGVAIPPHFP